jgi:hypothetical protein
LTAAYWQLSEIPLEPVYSSGAASMMDVFFSYSSKDRERVRPNRDALVAEGFDVL